MADRCKWDLHLLELHETMTSWSPKMCIITIIIIIIIIILIISLVFESAICVTESVVKSITNKIYATYVPPCLFMYKYLLQTKVCCRYFGNSGVKMHRVRNIHFLNFFTTYIKLNFLLNGETFDPITDPDI
jgi:hypothetical protein